MHQGFEAANGELSPQLSQLSQPSLLGNKRGRQRWKPRSRGRRPGAGEGEGRGGGGEQALGVLNWRCRYKPASHQTPGHQTGHRGHHCCCRPRHGRWTRHRGRAAAGWTWPCQPVSGRQRECGVQGRTEQTGEWSVTSGRQETPPQARSYISWDVQHGISVAVISLWDRLTNVQHNWVTHHCLPCGLRGQ